MKYTYKKYIVASLALLGIIALFSYFYMMNIYNIKYYNNSNQTNIAYFAGGCFWCTEADFEKLKGVVSVISGYMGGKAETANYNEVSSGKTTHRESIQVTYNPKEISYEELLTHFFMVHDPTDSGGSFFDRGHQYTSALFYTTKNEEEIAKHTIEQLGMRHIYSKPIQTVLEKAGTFYPAEEYHQDYYKKNPEAYSKYRTNSGRDAYIKKTWGQKQISASLYNTAPEHYDGKWKTYTKPNSEEIKKDLSNIEYNVTQESGTEPPFTHEYDKYNEPGIYVDKLSGEPLFSSTHKFDSKTGWPSFYKPISDELTPLTEEGVLGFSRLEVRSKYGDNHLGHVFEDGPEPTGLRYCINGAALTFIPQDSMEKKGYKELLFLFD